MQTLTIGQVARAAQVGVETVRFYERKGLIEKPGRRPSGYRQYPQGVIRRIRFIRRAKELGFSLKEIQELLALKVDPDANCGDVRHRATEKLEDIRAKIRTLEKMAATLSQLASTCSGQGPTQECPILQSLDEEGPES